MTPQIENNNSTGRLHYLDNLRALAMLIGIVFHVALAYSPLMQNVWFTSDTQNSVIIDIFTYFLHLFRMPLFFCISGYFALMLIEKRGLSGFMKNRMKRILLPFIIFFPLLSIAVMFTVSWALGSIETHVPLLHYLTEVLSKQDQDMPINTMHLWFLLNLFFFCCVLVLLSKLNFFNSALFSKLSSKFFILVLLPILMIPALTSVSAPHPAPGLITPQLWSFGFYGLFFILGAMLYVKKELLSQLVQFKLPLAFIALICYGYFYYQLPDVLLISDMEKEINGVAFSWHHLSMAIAECFAAVYLTVLSLMLGKTYLNQSSAIFKYIADSSYWLYLVHFPILLLIQFVLIDMELNLWLKFVLSNLIVFASGIVSYQILVRHTLIGKLLNGRIVKKRLKNNKLSTE